MWAAGMIKDIRKAWYPRRGPRRMGFVWRTIIGGPGDIGRVGGAA